MDCLTRTVKGSSLCNAMPLLQTFQDGNYLAISVKKGISHVDWT